MKLMRDWEGRLICGRYELEEYIAVGGMGHVFKAWDYMAKRWVVVKIASRVKVFVETGFTETLDVWLQKEVAALKRIDHPQIVRMFNFGVDEDFHFIVLEYIDGKDLSQVIGSGEGPLSIDLCVSIILQLLDVLVAMRNAGLIHRDIKPANIMHKSGKIKLIDFGLVKTDSEIISQEEWAPRDFLVGSPYYLSPEQVCGDPYLDYRSDICNVGIVFYELLTGQSPFTKRKEPMKWMYVWKVPLRPFPKKPHIPKKLQSIVWKALEIDPEDRYQTVEDMQAALLEAVQPFSFRQFVRGIWSRIRTWIPFIK